MGEYKGRPGAIILGGSFHSLGAARNLAEHNVPVCILDSCLSVARLSRYVSSCPKCPSIDNEAELVGFLVQLAMERDMAGWVVFPSTDEYVRIVAQHRNRLGKYYKLTTPDWEVVKFLYDKRLTSYLARDRSIPIPETHTLTRLEDLTLLNLDFPVVLKPAISKRFMAVTKKKAYRANNVEELISLYKEMAEIIDPSQILIQKLILGRTRNLYSYVGFFRGGVPVAGMSARRLRQHPMEFGRASTFVEAVNILELRALATRFLEGIAYTGLAEVEFMYDERDARFELLEVNARIWGWHSIAARAGLPLIYLAYADAIGEEMIISLPSKVVKWARLVTDVPTALREILLGRLTVRQYLASMSGDIEFAVLSLKDPLPFIADLLLTPYNYLTDRGF